MGNLISRQDAINVADAVWSVTGDKNVAKVWDQIKDLPSAQPEIIYCGECKHMMPNGKCRQFADSTIRPSASEFCSAGERKDNG